MLIKNSLNKKVVGEITKIDISHDDDYYTQRNNIRYPHSACNVTSGINWLVSSSIAFDCPQGTQPEDYLMDILHSEKAYKVMKELAPWAIGNYPPNQVWVMLEWGINELAGKKVCELRWNTSIQDIVNSIMHRRAVIVGGKFTNYGHFVTVVGFEKEKDNLCNIIIDDPYGNPLTNYKDVRGNSIAVPVKWFLDRVSDYKKNNQIWGYYYIGI